MGWLRGPLTQTDMMGWNLKCPLVYVSSSVGITNVEEEQAPLADFAPQWPLAVLHTNRGVDGTPQPQTRSITTYCALYF